VDDWSGNKKSNHNATDETNGGPNQTRSQFLKVLAKCHGRGIEEVVFVLSYGVLCHFSAVAVPMPYPDHDALL
jgi:hypothetical protein